MSPTELAMIRLCPKNCTQLRIPAYRYKAPSCSEESKLDDGGEKACNIVMRG